MAQPGSAGLQSPCRMVTVLAGLSLGGMASREHRRCSPCDRVTNYREWERPRRANTKKPPTPLHVPAQQSTRGTLLVAR